MANIADTLRAEPFDPESLSTALDRLGLAEADGRATGRAEKLIDNLARNPRERNALLAGLDSLLEDIARAADPLRALLNFSRLTEAIGDRVAFFRHLSDRPAVRLRLCRLLAFSQALADTLVREPELMDLLRLPVASYSRPQLRARADAALALAATQEGRLEALRRFRRRETLRIGLLDMERHTWRNPADFTLVVRQISDLAQVCVQAALRIVAAEEPRPQSESPPAPYASPPHGFCVIAMGKLGARELNYSSDIDLIFIHDGEAKPMDRLGQRLLKVLGESGAEGTLYRLDMRLRPEGKSGRLVTTLQYALNYYESYASAWEWQALIKSRAIAGDVGLARRFRRFTRDIVWAKRPDDLHLRDMLAMKRRSESTPDGSDPNNVKQGPGGIRDAEWVVQQLQMMVAPAHPAARRAGTLQALEKLTSLNALTPSEARGLRDGYLFLRVLEHRLQLLDELAVRSLPADMRERTALARRMGCARRGAAAARWLEEDHAHFRGEIRQLCVRMFWGWRDTGPVLTEEEDAVPGLSSLPGADSDDVRKRLDRLSRGTEAHPLPGPLSRQIAAVLPAALRHLGYAADPARAVVNLERLADASGNRLSLLRTLGDSEQLGRAVLTILGGSEFLSDTLIRFPELLDLAAQRTRLSQPRLWPEARAECRDYCMTFRDRNAAVRRWKRREMLRIGLRDLTLDVAPLEIAAEIAALAQACLDLACDEAGAALRPASERIGFCVLGMGKLGGGEMHYHSDADVLFAYSPPQPFEGAGPVATTWATELINWLGAHTEDGDAFEVDARLRPMGRDGPLALSLAGYLDYFERPSAGIAVWERQALTRSRFVAGDAATAAQLLAAIRHVAFPADWDPGWGDQLRHIKGRVERERAAHGSVFDVKLGPGALSDIEFTAQWLALKHGARRPDLQTPNTLHQIDAAAAAALLTGAEAATLRAAYVFLRRVELRLQITQEGTVHSLKKGGPEFEAWTRTIFPDAGDGRATELFIEEWDNRTSAVRAVMERVRDSL